MKTILAAIDFSESAKLVIEMAVALARSVEAHVALLHVIQPVSGTASGYGFTEASDKIARAAVLHAVHRLAHLQRQLSSQGISATASYVSGVPNSAIVEHAQKIKASYIVIGSHGHGTLYELIVGSTASRVIKDAPCPILVVPSRAQYTGEALSFDSKPIRAPEGLQPLAFSAHQ
jgi:nucleotide-binding universal stress UspA family protein